MDNKTFCNVFPAFKGGAELDALFSETQVESIKTYELKKEMVVTLGSDHLIPYHLITRMEALLTDYAYHKGGAGKKVILFVRFHLSFFQYQFFYKFHLPHLVIFFSLFL